MRFVAFIIAIMIMVPVYGQKAKKKEDGTELITYEEGIVYSLPRNGLKIHVNATVVNYTPGPYASFADELLGIKNVKTQTNSTWTIDTIKLDFFSEPDPENCYKTSGLLASMISLSPEGCLVGIGLDQNIILQNQFQTNRISYQSSENSIQFAKLTDSPILVQGDSTNRFRVSKISIEQMAAQAAARIFQCRKARLEIAAGLLDEFHPDGKAYEESLKELEGIEEGYISLFTGQTTQKSYSYCFDYLPESKSVKGEVVFRFSEQKGVLEKSDLSGKPFMLDIEKEESLTNKQGSKASSDNPYAGESGIYYRIPGIANIKVIYELKTFATLRTTLAQYGTVAPVPENLLDGIHKLEFYPETGGIKNIQKKL